jgi:hypothetical protein
MAKLIPRARLPQQYGVTDETIRRWRLSPKLNFPKPAAIINGREYYDETEIAEWKPQRAIQNSPVT